jgi:hypothetical protein
MPLALASSHFAAEILSESVTAERKEQQRRQRLSCFPNSMQDRDYAATENEMEEMQIGHDPSPPAGQNVTTQHQSENSKDTSALTEEEESKPQPNVPLLFITKEAKEDEEASASIPPEHVRSSLNENLNGTTVTIHTATVTRKAAKRTLPWDLAAGELDLVSSPPKKKPRLEDPFSASTDDAATKISLHETTSVSLPADDADDHGDADADPVRDARSKVRNWRLEEDAKLNSAVTNTRKKKHGKEYRTDWLAKSVSYQMARCL